MPAPEPTNDLRNLYDYWIAHRATPTTTAPAPTTLLVTIDLAPGASVVDAAAELFSLLDHLVVTGALATVDDLVDVQPSPFRPTDPDPANLQVARDAARYRAIVKNSHDLTVEWGLLRGTGDPAGCSCTGDDLDRLDCAS